MAADTYDLTIDQGADWSWTIRWKVGSNERRATLKDTDGYTARMQVREKYSSPNALVTLSTENDRIVFGSDGSFQLNLPSSVTEELTPGKYVYDFEAISPEGTVTKLVRGTFRVVAEVTR
jgi:hypothetical protein